MRDLALALLAASPAASSAAARSAGLVDERLHLSLVRFAGADGFAALVRRALALASAQLPTLRAAKVSADGRIDGLEQIFVQDDSMRREAAVTVTTHLLELLVAFIGEPLTRRLVREACPETSPEEQR
jgi:DNA-binding GntR family transcriptional regulator